MLSQGISGNFSLNMLWRLKHGKMPDYFDWQIWLVMTVCNDLMRWGCSEDLIDVGTATREREGGGSPCR